MKINVLLTIVLCLVISNCFAQSSKVHSHNDYDQNVPFWTAYSSGAGSIEADVFLKDGVLFVTHAEDEIISERTLESLYLMPLKNIFADNGGKKYPKEKQRQLQILIDIKSEATESLETLIELLKTYPALTNHPRLRFVISGSRPDPIKYHEYPDYIWFDHQDLEPIPEQALEKVALISLSFRQFSEWNGKGRIAQEELKQIKEAIKKAHSYKKPFRFWATPDSKTAWETMSQLGVDYINTDQPFRCVEFVSSL